MTAVCILPSNIRKAISDTILQEDRSTMEALIRTYDQSDMRQSQIFTLADLSDIANLHKDKRLEVTPIKQQLLGRVLECMLYEGFEALLEEKNTPPFPRISLYDWCLEFLPAVLKKMEAHWESVGYFGHLA